MFGTFGQKVFREYFLVSELASMNPKRFEFEQFNVWVIFRIPLKSAYSPDKAPYLRSSLESIFRSQ